MLRNKEKQKEYEQQCEATNKQSQIKKSVFGAPIISDQIKMTDETDLTISIAQIAKISAMEEQNKSRARLLQQELKRNMKPIQKALRATQFSQFNFVGRDSSIKNLLRSQVGELCED